MKFINNVEQQKQINQKSGGQIEIKQEEKENCLEQIDLLIHETQSLKISPSFLSQKQSSTSSSVLSPLEQLANYLSPLTAGYTPEDLIKIKNELIKVCIGREWVRRKQQIENQILTKEQCSLENDSPFDYNSFIQIQSDDVNNALTVITPSLASGTGFVSEVPNTQWEDIGGAHEVKRKIIESVVWPTLHHQNQSDNFSLNSQASSSEQQLPQRLLSLIPPPRGVLLWGPPGTAKTTIVKASCRAMNAQLIVLSCAGVYSCYVGDAERILREAFHRARQSSPCVLFLDEIDSIVGKRGGEYDGNGVKDRILTTLLTEMDGIEHIEGVIVMAATNRADLLDDALLRPGRFDVQIQFHLPNTEERAEILLVYLKKITDKNIINIEKIERKFRYQKELEQIKDRKTNLDENKFGHKDDDDDDRIIDLYKIASETNGFSGADIEALCIEAVLNALNDNINQPIITSNHFDTALDSVKGER